MFTKAYWINGLVLALTWIKQRDRRLVDADRVLRLCRGGQLVWSSTRILWDQQILLLWLLLLSAFVASVLLAFAAPFLFGEAAIQDADGDAPANRPDLSSEMKRRKAA